MKNTYHFSAYFLFCSLAILSCKDSPTSATPEQSKPDYLVPLVSGNKWTFRVTTFNTAGDTTWVDTISFHIGSDTTVQGLHWFTYDYDGPSSGSEGYRNDEWGFHETNWESLWYSYPYPAHRGDSISYYKVVSVDTSLMTPFGMVKCYQYQFSWYGLPMNTFFAPHIGMVRRESAGMQFGSITPYRSQDLDLIGYKLY